MGIHGTHLESGGFTPQRNDVQNFQGFCTPAYFNKIAEVFYGIRYAKTGYKYVLAYIF